MEEARLTVQDALEGMPGGWNRGQDWNRIKTVIKRCTV